MLEILYSLIRLAYMVFVYMDTPIDDDQKPLVLQAVALSVVLPTWALDQVNTVLRLGIFLFYVTAHTQFAERIVRPYLLGDLQLLTVRLASVSIVHELVTMGASMIILIQEDLPTACQAAP